jgi:hypothetical protein
MAVKFTAITPTFGGVYTLTVGTSTAYTVKLISVTVPGSTPEQVFVVNPMEAMTTNVCLGQPYCTTAGTVVVPVINPTAGNINVTATTVALGAL